MLPYQSKYTRTTAYECTHIHTPDPPNYTYTRTHTYAYVHFFKKTKWLPSRLYTYTLTHTYAYIRIYMHIYAYICATLPPGTYIYPPAHICVYLHANIC